MKLSTCTFVGQSQGGLLTFTRCLISASWESVRQEVTFGLFGVCVWDPKKLISLALQMRLSPSSSRRTVNVTAVTPVCTNFKQTLALWPFSSFMTLYVWADLALPHWSDFCLLDDETVRPETYRIQGPECDGELFLLGSVSTLATNHIATPTAP